MPAWHKDSAPQIHDELVNDCSYSEHRSALLGLCRISLYKPVSLKNWKFVQFLSHANSLRSHGLQHTQLLCPPLSPRVCSILSIKSVMLSSHLICCRPLLFSPSVFPSIRIFSNESALQFRWPEYWSFNTWLPWWLSSTESASQCRRHGFNPWVRKIPWRREGLTCSNMLAWEIPWTKELGGLQSMRVKKELDTT